MTISLLVTVAILVAGTAAIWMLFTSRRPQPAPPATTPPVTEAEPEPAKAFDAALNLYLTAPAAMPAGAGRVEMTLVKASLLDADGKETTFFEGSQRVVLQEGAIEKVLSERIPAGRWTRLKLTFSPAADLSFADGRPDAGALAERREAVLAFDAEVAASRTLALFARAPLEAASGEAGGVITLNFSPEPAAAELYVFGSFFLDPRGRGGLWNVASPSLAAVVKEDLGFDITRQLPGSSGFVPAPTAP